MPVTPNYPGVYIEEVSSGVRTIVGVSTSVTGFVDFFAKGPMNKAVRVLSFADFERSFGGLHRLSEASYAIRQFFLNGGTNAYVVRVARAGTFGTSEFTLQDPATASLARVYAGIKIGRDSYENPGVWGDSLRLEIDYDTTNPASEFNLTVVQVASTTARYVPVASETFRNLTWSAGPSNAVEVINEQSKLIQLDRSTFTSTSQPVATGTIGNPIAATTPIPPNGAQLLINGNTLTLDYGTAPTTLGELKPYLQAAIRAANPTDPLIAGATVNLFQHSAIPEQYRFHVIGGRGERFAPASTLQFADGSITAASLGLDGPHSAQQFELTGGSEATVEADLPGSTALVGSQSAKSGIYAFTDVDLFNILCIPRAAELATTELNTVVEAAQELCRLERAFLLVDIPEDVNQLSDMEAWMTGTPLRHSNAAVYFPRTRVADPLNGNRLRSIGASGTMAGLYARIDADRGVWKAPAGIEASLNGVQVLDYLLTDAENGVLNPIGVNCLRQFDVFGNVAWGARTLDGADKQASEWKYIPVRRTALFLEESLYRGTQWVVFEPNDEPLWSQIRLNVGAFMNRLFRQGAFQGSTPRQAYFVKCDSETTTQDDINNGIVNILVGFAPLKPAEFVIIKISQIAGDIPT